MSNAIELASGVGLRAGRKSRWPARMDVAQGVTGLVLAVFMWAHMALVSSILLGEDVMWRVSKFFEGYPMLSTPQPWIVTVVAVVVFALLVVHAALAVRKFPITHRQFAIYRDHMKLMRHEDTTLWYWQVVTGFALFFLAAAHLVIIGTHPDRIGPYESADRVWSEWMWPLYLVLLFAVEIHGGVGLYRLALKWGWFASSDPNRTRHRLRTVKWALTVFLLVLGIATLAAYMKIGIAHADRAGQPYVPTFLQQGAPR